MASQASPETEKNLDAQLQEIQNPNDEEEPQVDEVYTVCAGDSLLRISYLTGLSVRAIKKTNNLMSDAVIAG
jgi:LysM repeat protein